MFKKEPIHQVVLPDNSILQHMNVKKILEYQILGRWLLSVLPLAYKSCKYEPQNILKLKRKVEESEYIIIT